MLQWLCNGADDTSSACHCSSLNSSSVDPLWILWRTKWQWDMCLSQYCRFTCQYLSTSGTCLSQYCRFTCQYLSTSGSCLSQYCRFTCQYLSTNAPYSSSYSNIQIFSQQEKRVKSGIFLQKKSSFGNWGNVRKALSLFLLIASNKSSTPRRTERLND